MDSQLQSLNDVIAPVNSGVFYFANGHYKEAIALFQSALRMAKMQLKELSWYPTDDQKGLSCCSHVTKTPRIHIHYIYPSQSKCSSAQYESVESDSKKLFVFRGIIQISSYENPTSVRDAQTLPPLFTAISLVALHNLALSHLIIGMQSKCLETLQAALEFYSVARELHEESRKAFGQTYHCRGIRSLPLMSILNNLGVLYRHLKQDHPMSKSCFRDLLSVIVLYRENNEFAPGLRNGDTANKCKRTSNADYCLDGFWRNLSYLILRDFRTAKAA